MNISPEKQKHYEHLYEEMYQKSLRTGKTPVPAELNDPVERGNFLNWRHELWVKVSGSAAAAYQHWLDNAQPSVIGLRETPSPSPSKT